MIDGHLNWKAHVSHVTAKIKRNAGIISKTCCFVDINILIKVYYTLIYLFSRYGFIVWGNTYPSTINPQFILQKRAIQLLSCSDYNEHTNPLFIKLKIVKFHDLVYIHNAIFVYNYNSGNLPNTFDTFFVLVNQKHNYNTRLSSRSSYSLPKIRTNYGKFNIRYTGAKVWNSIDENIKRASLTKFKEHLISVVLESYENK